MTKETPVSNQSIPTTPSRSRATQHATPASMAGKELERLSIGDERCHLSGLGMVAALEERLKSFYGMRYALCVSSATAGLMALALALDLRSSEFVTTPYTWGGTIAGWLYLGNRPLFADIEPHTLGLYAESARRRITAATRALLAVDIFGLPSDMRALRRLADEYGLVYVADAAQSFGALRDGVPASSLADALVLSFTTGKSLAVGEGGAVLTNSADIYEKLLWHTQHPQRQRRELGLHHDNEFALNARIHPWAAMQADAQFDQALQSVQSRRLECYSVIQALNSSGLTERITLPDGRVEPSFSRLTSLWRDRPRPACLKGALGGTFDVIPAPVRLLYRQPAFLSQYGNTLRSAPRCPEAERQARKRFELVTKRRGERS